MEKNSPKVSDTVTHDDREHKHEMGSSRMSESPRVDPEEGDIPNVRAERTDAGDGEKERDKMNTDEKAEENTEPGVDNEAVYSLEKALEDIDNFLSAYSSTPNENDVLETPDFVEKFLNLAEARVDDFCNSQPEKTWLEDPKGFSFLEVVDRISKLATLLEQHKSRENFASLNNRIGSIQERAMSFLEDEFRSFLDECRPIEADRDESGKPKQESSEESEKPNEGNSLGYKQEVLTALNKIANVMITGGYENECCQVYIVTRRNSFEELLNNLKFENISIDDVQKMQWEALEREIVKWNNIFKECASVHFTEELKLAEAVFEGHSSIATQLFCNLVRSVIIQILNFSEAVAMTSKRTAEKLFKFLDMYETLRDTAPAMDGFFKEEDGANHLRTEIMTARSRIGEAIICMFNDLENSIKSDTGKNAVPGGAVHPLTRYTVNYLKYACEYKDTLEQVFRDHMKIERADSHKRSEFQGDGHHQTDSEKQSSPFQMQLMKVMDLLDSNLEGKSKLYRDLTLSSIFMMNNGRYILQKVKGSPEINELMGDPWRRKKSSELREFHKNYKRETWSKVLNCFREEGLTVNGKVVKPELKERFKAFNAMFDEIHKTQSAWVVSDEQMQSELQVSITAVVIPAYRSFMARYSQHLTPGRQTEKYIKYQPEDLETYIDDLFDGNKSNAGKRKQ